MDGRRDRSPVEDTGLGAGDAGRTDVDGELTLLSRVELEEIIRSRSATLGHVMDAMVDVLFKLDAEGRIELVNQSVHSTLGYDPDFVIGKPLDALLVGPGEGETPTDELVTADRFGEILVRDGHVPDVEVAFRAADGTVIPMSLSTSAMDATETASGFVCVGKDIRERIEREHRLEDTNEQLELLNTLVRHDIRNDVVLIINLVRHLQSTVDDADGPAVLGEREREHLANIEELGHRITSLTETARTLIETLANLEQNQTPTPLAPVLQREVANASILSSDAGIEVEGTYPDVSVWANELLPSVFRNLLTNAILHNDADEPAVSISTTVTDTDVTVRIADNGPGLPPALLESLQSGGCTPEPSGPHGFGLYIVQTILQHHEGQLAVEVGGGSDSDGAADGTAFDVTLPRVVDG